jgi:glycine betaine/choline ABC-type transport system substrate-binding protein
MNAQVEIDKKDPADVAKSFIDSQGLAPTDTSGSGDVTVGVSAAFAENQIVAELYAQILEAAGYTVSRELDLASREVSDPALTSGKIDVKPEYLASELLFLDPKAKTSGDPQAEVDQLTPLLKKNGVSILQPSEANDQNAFVVTGETASKYGLSKVSDLAKPAP